MINEMESDDNSIIEIKPDFLDCLIASVIDESQRAPNAIWKLFLVYKYVKKGKDIDAVRNDKRWDKLNSERQSSWCRKVLEAYDMDIKKASQSVLKIGEYYEDKNLMWDMSTVHKRLTDWEEGRLG